MRMRWTLLALFTLLFLGVAAPARAEEPSTISVMDVSVWPEYDQAGVLVQYQGNLTGKADKTNPIELSFFVPKGAGVGAACGIQSNGNHTSEQWKETDADNNLTRVTFKVTEPQFHVEYYYNPLTSSSDRKFSFAYTAALAADEVQMDIQHPLRVTNFALTPDAPNSHKDNDGFTYHGYDFKSVAAGQKLATDIAYTKTDNKPSVSGDKPASATNANVASTDSGVNPNQVIVLGTFLAMGGIIAYFVWERRQRTQPRRYAPVVEHDEAPAAAGTLSADGFCTQCGNPMHAGDRFCGRCGTPVTES